jgi:hypothetical protein
VLTVNLSEAEAKAALHLAGQDVSGWLRGLVDVFLAANGHKTAATGRRAPEPPPASSRPPLPARDWPAHPSREQYAERLAAITAWKQDGYSLAEIGAAYGITRERVRQLLPPE